jgi:hypothetical protein
LRISAPLYEISVAHIRIFYKFLKQSSFLRLTRDTTAPMKASQLFKLLLLVALAAWMHILASPAKANANVAVTPTLAAEPLQSAQSSHLPETSSVVLISAVGIMLMLRRRRLHD